MTTCPSCQAKDAEIARLKAKCNLQARTVRVVLRTKGFLQATFTHAQAEAEAEIAAEEATARAKEAGNASN